MKTGNVKISELERHSYLYGNEVFPISWKANEESNYNSYNVTLSNICNYIDGKSHLNRDLGLYDNGEYSKTYTIDFDNEPTSINEAIGIDGNIITNKNGYWISKPISVKKGILYCIKFSELLSDVAPFAKVITSTCYNISGYNNITVIKQDGDEINVNEPVYINTPSQSKTYEPITKHYLYIKDNPDASWPSSGLALFYATDDMDIVVSAKKEDIYKQQFNAINSALFSDMAEKFAEKNGNEAGVIAETLANLDARLSAIEKHAGISTVIDSMQMIKYHGNDFIIVKDRAPETLNKDHLTECPAFIGQIWIDTTNKDAYIGVSFNSTGTTIGWKKITS